MILTKDDLRIEKQGDSFLLFAKALDELKDADEVFREAQRIALEISGFSLLYLGEPTPVAVRQINSRQAGMGQGFVQVSTAAVIRGPKTGPRYRPDLVRELIVLSQRDEEVAKVGRLWGSQVFDWINLSRIYEVIRADVGNETKLIASGWADESEIGLFKRTANTSASGDASRHGWPTTAPPEVPMDLGSAATLMECIVRNWLSEKAAKPSE